MDGRQRFQLQQLWSQSDDENQTCVEINYTGASHFQLHRRSSIIRQLNLRGSASAALDLGHWNDTNCDLKKFYMCMQLSWVTRK